MTSLNLRDLQTKISIKVEVGKLKVKTGELKAKLGELKV